MEKDFRKKFDLCPVCGSDRQFLKELGDELKERGLARPEWNMRYDSRQGIVFDQDRQTIFPIGISLPGYYIMTDICMDCGTVYAVEMGRIEGKTAAHEPSKVLPPQHSNN